MNINKNHLEIGVIFVFMAVLVFVPKGDLTSVERTEVEALESDFIVQVAQNQSLPKTLRIPKLNIETSFGSTLGLTDSGEVAVPDNFSNVGLYEYGPRPGELGPAVVLGHVDSYEGPAVFYSIGQLDLDDKIEIETEDGTKLTFIVTDSVKYLQDDFPTELVYGDLDHAGLRLVTCSGTYNRDKNRYTHNRVIYARLEG